MKITELEWMQIREQFSLEEQTQIADAVSVKLVCIDCSTSYVIIESKLSDFLKLKLQCAKLELTQ